MGPIYDTQTSEVPSAILSFFDPQSFVPGRKRQVPEDARHNCVDIEEVPGYLRQHDTKRD